jgi:hypothetical protein
VRRPEVLGQPTRRPLVPVGKRGRTLIGIKRALTNSQSNHSSQAAHRILGAREGAPAARPGGPPEWRGTTWRSADVGDSALSA